VIRNLLAHEHNHLMERTESFIMLTHELLPSDTAHMDVSKLVAVVTEVGGKASHAAILARSLSIPAVTGVALNTLPTDLGEVLVDGREGILIINPTQKDKDLYASKKEVFLKFKEKLLSRVHEMPATQDGTPIDILTNIENFEDINPVDYETLNGIGLYRTEYIFMNRNSFPSEEEQYQFYSTIVKRVGPDKEITFRTIDIGGDKKLPYFKAPDEANPVLGWRGARIILEWPDIFYTQVRALLRAGVHGWVNIMIPMVTDLEEVRCANRYFKEIQDDLRKHGIPYGENLKLGVMIEVPSAAWDIKNIVLETEFVSIGTNDLIQYILAVDRNNARVATKYQPLNPAVLKVIHWVIQAGVDAGKRVSICGEMAGNFNYTQLLLGMGLRSFSMAPFYVNGVKQVLRSTTIADAERIAGRALNMKTTEEIRTYLKSVNPLKLTNTAKARSGR
jgi:phosphotransferase system enzyme I (PtsI)